MKATAQATPTNLPQGLSLTDIIEVNGMKFTRKDYIPEVAPGRSNADKFKGLTSFGRLAHDMNFTDRKSLADKMKTLDSVHREPVYRARNLADAFHVDEAGAETTETNPTMETRIVPDRYSLVSDLNGEDYEIVSGRYRIIQDIDLFQPLYNAAAELGLNPVGKVWGVGTGTTNAMVMFNNPEFVIPVLHVFDDPIAIGFHLRNSYGVNSVFAKAVGFRMVCCNFNWWGEFLGQFAFKHFVAVDTMQGEFEKVIKEALTKSPQLREVMEKASAIEVRRDEIATLLYAVIPDYDNLIEEISLSPEKFCPEIKELGINNLTVYHMGTAGVTHRMTSGNMNDYDGVGERLNKLLTEKQDTLIEQGRKAHKAAIEREVERLKAQQTKIQTKMTVMASKR